MQEITTKVEKQEVEIQYIKKTLDELVDTNKKQMEQLAKISESIVKQEVILEKISNLEDKYSDGIKRVHKRIDEEVRSIDKEVVANSNNIIELGKKVEAPCSAYNTITKEIEFINNRLAKHDKIFWWLGTLILSSFVLAVIDAVIKK